MALIPARGRPTAPLFLEVERELSLEDLLEFSKAEHARVVAPATKRLRTIHLRIAQHVAMGRSNEEVARICNITSERVRQLQNDPAFNELVAYYCEQISEVTIEAGQRVQEKLLDIAELALDSLHEQLEIGADKISVSERRQIAQMALDRTVAPPKSTSQGERPPVNVTLNLGRELKPQEKVIDADPATLSIVEEIGK